MRILIIPAAGAGTRLGSDRPKALTPVGGRSMLDILGSLYERFVSYTVVVANPAFARDIEQWTDDAGAAEVVEQASPTGMLDAILLGASAVMRLRPTSIWITWCDQVGVLPATLERLDAATSMPAPPALVMPTVHTANPYIHFPRDPSGTITGVLHRREGDPMPTTGESDMGLFALSRRAFDVLLPEYANTVTAGAGTGERNFLPFIPWLAAREAVVTIDGTDPREALGVNTPEDLAAMEHWLRTRHA